MVQIELWTLAWKWRTVIQNLKTSLFQYCLVFFSTIISHWQKKNNFPCRNLIIQTHSLFKSHLVVQIWAIIYVEYFVNIVRKIGQKIQVKAKFPQAVITNIRTLPPVFPKMFWTAVWRKTWDGCFWHYLCKTIYSCSGKVALAVFTEMCSTTVYMEIKMLI